MSEVYYSYSILGEIIDASERTLVSELSAEGVYPMMEVIGKLIL